MSAARSHGRGPLAVPELAAPLSARRKLRLSGEVLLAYCWVRWWLRRHEVRDVVRRLRDNPRAPLLEIEQSEAEYESGLRLGRAVARTLRLLPTDGRCLMRSLVLTRMLDRRGISSTLIIGVRPAPEFVAHAWVEHDGRPLLYPGEPGYGRLAEM